MTDELDLLDDGINLETAWPVVKDVIRTVRKIDRNLYGEEDGPPGPITQILNHLESLNGKVASTQRQVRTQWIILGVLFVSLVGTGGRLFELW